MAAGRHQVDYSGIDYKAITVKIDNSTIVYDSTQLKGSAVAGRAVTWSAPDTVKLVADGEFVLGKLLQVENDNFASVQVRGFVELPGGTGAALTRGKGVVGALLVAALGYVREVATATAAELGLQNGHIVNAAVTTAVVVDLG